MSSISSTNSSYMNYSNMMQGVQGQGHHKHGQGQGQQATSATMATDSFFSQLDIANQGYIDQSQLSSAMGGDASSNNSSQLFSALDTDSDGKLTKEELAASLEKQFADARGQFETRMATQGGGKGQHGQHGGMMPPPTENDDEGYTAEELTALSQSEETDSKRASLMATLAENFSAVDTDADGKVTRSEGMAYQKSQKQASSNTSSTATTASSVTDSSSTNSTSNTLSLQAQLEAMMRLYNINAGTTQSTTSLSFSA